jgi:hypothetical protein
MQRMFGRQFCTLRPRPARVRRRMTSGPARPRRR